MKDRERVETRLEDAKCDEWNSAEVALPGVVKEGEQAKKREKPVKKNK